MDLTFLPAVNATLNSIATALLVVGRILIKRGKVRAHRIVMLSAFGVSTLFLGLYLLHKASRSFESTTLHAEGAAKAAYLVLLFSHLTLAMTVPVLALFLLRFGLRDERAKHRRLARIAWPVWLYVSVTGVLIYFILYHWNPVV